MRYELAEADQEDQKDQIVITIHESDARDLCVRSVDLFSNPIKVRVSAKGKRQLAAIFQQEIADIIEQICATATLAEQIINVPDFALRIRGLVVQGYTLLVHTMENGLRQFIVRLRRGIGNALALFRSWNESNSGLSILPSEPEAPTGKSGKIGAHRLFDEMLSHLYLPLVNMNSFLKQALESKQDGRGPEFSSSIVQLKTKAEVLQFAFDRVISEMVLDKYANSGAAKTVDARNLALPELDEHIAPG